MYQYPSRTQTQHRGKLEVSSVIGCCAMVWHLPGSGWALLHWVLVWSCWWCGQNAPTQAVESGSFSSGSCGQLKQMKKRDVGGVGGEGGEHAGRCWDLSMSCYGSWMLGWRRNKHYFSTNREKKQQSPHLSCCSLIVCCGPSNNDGLLANITLPTLMSCVEPDDSVRLIFPLLKWWKVCTFT